MSCNNRNGKTEVVSLTPYPGGTAANADYLLALDFFTCGNRKVCTQEVYPISADVKFKPLGVPVAVPAGTAGNENYCCDVLVTGTVTYMPYVYGCKCNVCPRTDNIYTTICIPCSSASVPTITAGVAVAAPVGTTPCCNETNEIAITTSLNVTTA